MGLAGVCGTVVSYYASSLESQPLRTLSIWRGG